MSTLEIANSACLGGLTAESACLAATPFLRDICCVPDGSNSYQAAAPSPTESSGISTGAIAGIVVGTLFLIAVIGVLAIRMSNSGTAYDTNSPAIKAAIEDHKNLEQELSEQDSYTNEGSGTGWSAEDGSA